MESGTKRTGFEKFYAIYLMCAIFAPIAYLLTYRSTTFNRINLSVLVTFSILVQVSLLLQSIRIDIFGLKYRSYYGPYISIGYRNDVSYHFDIDINLQFIGINEYEEYSPYIIFYLNLITIFLLIKFIKRKKENSLEDSFLMEE